jgi:carbon storage regulator
MLVLSRKQGEKIHIGDQIILEVRRIVGNRVTLGIEAPADVRIARGELTLVLPDVEALQNGSGEPVSLRDLVRKARGKLGADVQETSAS